MTEPALASIAAPVLNTSHEHASKHAHRRANHSARILVAEDNETNQIVALAQLRKLGYEADAVSNGAEAIEAIKNREYDLILMDCEMPIMDGYEATRKLRGSGHHRIPIIALTASAMQGDRARCICEGMNDFLTKPVDLARLEETLVKWCAATDISKPGTCAEQNSSERAEAIFDSEALLNRLMGDRQLADIVLQGFVDNSPSILDNLHACLVKGDARGARLQAHTLKGSAATVSACRLNAIALEIEEAAGAGELTELGALIPRAVEEFDRFESELEQAGRVKPKKEAQHHENAYC